MPIKSLQSQDVNNLIYHSTDELQNAVKIEAAKSTILGYKRILQTGDKLYDNASLKLKDGDEETAFIFYMRAVEMYKLAPKCKDYNEKRDKIHYRGMCGHKVKECLDQAEKLFTSLERKYSILKEIDEVQRKEKAELEELQENQKKFGRLKEDLENNSVAAKQILSENKPSTVLIADEARSDNSITCDQLYDILYSNKNLLILDIRPENEFNESHIKSDACINISEDSFVSGVTASRVESQLKSVSDKLKFKKRHDVDYVILVDWQSKADYIETKGNSLRLLFNALHQYDNAPLKRAPVVLDGGYKTFLCCYPTLTTNGAFVKRESAGADCISEGSTSKASDSWSFPELSPFSIIKRPPLAEIQQPIVQPESPKQQPYVRRFQQERPQVPDRTLKPNISVSVPPRRERTRSVSPVINEPLDSEYNQAITFSKKDEMKSHLDETIKKKIVEASRVVSEIETSDENSEPSITSQSVAEKQEKDSIIEKQHDNEIILEAKSEQIDQLVQQLDRLRALKPKSTISAADSISTLPDNQKSNEERLENEVKKLQLECDDLVKQKVELIAQLDRKNQLELLRKERKLNEKLKKDVILPENNEIVIDNDLKKFDRPNENAENSYKNNARVEEDDGNRQSSQKVDKPVVSSSVTVENTASNLKRTQSSPNIPKIAAQEQAVVNVLSHTPAIDRTSKPSAANTEQLLHQEAQFFATAVNSLRTVGGNVKPGLTGLRNLGCTCYMNSTIQCLSNTEPLRQFFLGSHYRKDINYTNKLGFGGEAARNFAVLLHGLWSGRNRVVIPYEFKRVAGILGSQFNNFLQQDAQEFANYLLDGLHEDLNRVKFREPVVELNSINVRLPIAANEAWQSYLKLNNSIIVDLFQGQFLNVIQCQTCNILSSVFDPVLFLTLPLPTDADRCSLERCLKGLLEAEYMTGDSRWACPKCKCKRDAKKSFNIWKLPRVLIICLKRFQGYGRYHQKLRTTVEFPVNSPLNLANYVGVASSYSSYKLYGVVNHYGTMEGGHYTAYCRNGGSWFEFDDDKVSEISDRNIVSASAYLLFYMAQTA